MNYSIDSILYEDTLVCSLPNSKDIGSFEIKLSKTTHGDLHDCIEIVADRFVESLSSVRFITTSPDSSQAKIDNVPCGTNVRAVVTRDLVTLHQEYTEYVKVI